jgi:hypothetical protein
MPTHAAGYETLLCWVSVLVSVCATCVLAGDTDDAGTLRVDFAKSLNEIRALHGGNCGPLQYGEITDLSASFRELGMPYTRLHDCHWPNPDVVDLHVVFPNPDADPEMPASYDFLRTDDYLAAVIKTGAKIVYRLGESIEHTKRKYHVHPPKDPQRWAAACLGIIRHYNDGWADGFRHEIRYWEIWNEPENRPAMWTGNDEQYFTLYETASKAIKARWPDLKVGGPSLGYTGQIKNGQFEPGEFLTKFLERCRDRKLPLDFFSWHLYTDNPSECMTRAKGIRDLLNRMGFAKTELHFNEWNYLPGNDWSPITPQGTGAARERCFEQIGGPPGAAFVACVLANLQDTPVDVANYYLSDNHGFGLFTFHGTPRKNFYAMKAFHRLLDTPQRVEVSGTQPDRLAACAGLNAAKTEAGILIGNYRSDRPLRLRLQNLPWTGPTRFELAVIDATHNLETIRKDLWPAEELDLSADLKAPAVGLLTLKPK